MAKKTIKFYYYSPCSLDGKKIVFGSFIDDITCDSDNDYEMYQDCDNNQIGIKYIKKHEKYKIESGPELDYTTWEICFIRSRYEIPSKYNIKTKVINELDLDDDERLIEETVVLYVKKDNIIIIERNNRGVSKTGIEGIFNKYIADKNDYIKFVTIIKKDQWERIESKDKIWEVELCIPYVNNSKAINKIEDDSVKNAIESMNLFSPENKNDYRVKAKIKISISNNRKKEKDTFPIAIVKSCLQNINSAFDGKVKGHIKGNSFEQEKAEVIAFQDCIECNQVIFDVNRDNRYISSSWIFDRMCEAYNSRRMEQKKEDSSDEMENC